MPVVARSIQILSGSLSASAILTALLLAGSCIVGGSGFAQETTEPAEATPAPAAVQTDPPVGGNCAQMVLAQRQLNRAVTAIRNPLPRPANADKRAYVQLLANGFSTPAETQVIQEYLAWQILQATDPVFTRDTKNMQGLLDDMSDDMSRCGNNIGSSTRQTEARKKFCAEVLTVTKPLLDNNMDARFAAASIMQSLHEVKAVQNGAKARLYGGALAALLAILNDPQQPDGVKARAANAIHNVLVNCEFGARDQFEICDALAGQLARPCTDAPYQEDLIDAVIEIPTARKTIGLAEPTVYKVLAAVISDREKPVEVRCRAAFGIGQGAFDLQMKLEPLAWKITQLAADTAVEFNKAPGDPRWPRCGIELLLAFRHQTSAQASGPVLTRKGLMNRDPNSKLIDEAAPFITAVALKLIDNKEKFNIAELTPMAEWLRTTQVDGTWDTNAPPLPIP